MLYLYYNNEVRMLKDSCSMEISSVSMEIKRRKQYELLRTLVESYEM